MCVRADEIADEIRTVRRRPIIIDGVLSGDELNAAPYLRQLDLNGDGKVTLEEAREALSKMRGAIAEEAFWTRDGRRLTKVAAATGNG